LFAHSREEEIAGDFICFGNPDAVLIVCDATCLERNLNLVLQTLEITDNVVLCINLMDEAERKKIYIDTDKISEKLNIPVVKTVARKKKGLFDILDNIELLVKNKSKNESIKMKYTLAVEEAIEAIIPVLNKKNLNSRIKHRWIALKLLEGNSELINKIGSYTQFDIEDSEIEEAVNRGKAILEKNSINSEKLKDITARSLVLHAEEICSDTVCFGNPEYNLKDRKIDKLLTGKLTGVPVMLLMLGIIFWLTICAANVPSAFLSDIFFRIENWLVDFCVMCSIPESVYGVLIFGVYRVVSWVVSVMLPPMAIFFPLFTLLEDLGYLPRVAFNMDGAFKKCHACGKQALTMCMGFGCNAAGITGCRIIDSPRERLIAVLTNNFVPCNGRFPMLITVITVFFSFSSAEPFNSVIGAAVLMLAVFVGIAATFLVSAILSKTVLKGTPSSFTLELPPYRVPRTGEVIIRSICDRTVFVLGRAIVSAAPAGLVIWLFANTDYNGVSLLKYCSDFLDPFGHLICMDGKIILGFILGIPANEIVVPIIVMAYTSGASLQETGGLMELKAVFEANGWTLTTAISFILFSVMHWPCATSLMTVKKETGSMKWTLLAFLIPTICGILVCFVFNSVVKLIF